MKNKTTTYILITGVLIVWGLIFYRIFSGMDSGDDTVVSIPKKKPVQVVEEKEEGILVLLTNYRDPFLGGTSSAISSQSFSGGSFSGVKKVVRKIEPKKEETPIDWSFLDYVGIVLNKETKKKVGLLIISGQEYMVNEKDVINGVSILRKERDSIQVKYNEKEKWVKR